MLTTIRYVLLTALRDRLFLALVGCMLLAVMLSKLLGYTALVEQEAMTLVFATASSRIILVMGLVVFVCFNIRNAFESREIDVMLSRPISRGNLVVAYQLGFSVVGALLVLALGAILFTQPVQHMNGLAVWLGSLYLEILLVIALSLFSAFALKSAVNAVMMTLGFYVLSRMMGFFMITAEHSGLFDTLWLNTLIKQCLIGVSTVIPRLDFFANSEWIIYGLQKESYGVAQFPIQALVFIPLLLAAAIADFRRKQF